MAHMRRTDSRRPSGQQRTLQRLYKLAEEKVSALEAGKALGLVVDRNGRCKCPIHHGEHRNCMLYDGRNGQGFYCFTCKASGNVVSFVAQVMNTTHSEALEWLNRTFNLGMILGEKIKISQVKQDETIRLQLEDIRNIEAFDAAKLVLEQYAFERYLDLFDELRMLEMFLEASKPKKPEDKWSDLFCQTIQDIRDVKEEIERMSLIVFRGKDDERTYGTDKCSNGYAECSERTGQTGRT